ncbi:hypothetical protein [Eleftheria terrae]|uniref:hypothetical protein n=1 Tax=Eleftheria terrae TaxID=1597781 RepID=UPI00263BAFEF|nr:hypothetical protein [Eleftheria terrae]WKB53024.1 hypothetical protein N7L95_01055 [Eleftheria terrae]
MLDDAFQASTDAALTDLVQRPRPVAPPAPAFSFWRMLSAAPKGAAAGTAEVAGHSADILGAFGQVLGATGTASAGGMFSTQNDQERRESQAAAEKIRAEGVNLRSDGGDVFRNVAKDYLPDPLTSHWSEQIVGNIVRVGTKAVGAGMVLGPGGGAIVAGADEGLTVADELADAGVDAKTRMKVGAVTGALTAAGFALPVAGTTWLRTGALALAGGPASFVAQQAATREILQGADYGQLADRYDPFDPVGLTLSTLLPLGFGAAAMRGAGRRARVTEPAAGGTGLAARATEGAETGTPPSERTPVARAIDEQVVEAARVSLIRETVESWNLGRAEDIQAAAAHLEAVARASDQLARGGRADVSDLVPADVVAASRVMDTMIERFEGQRAELLAEAGDLAQAGAVRAMREELAELQRLPPDTSDAGLKALAKEIQAAEGVSYKQAQTKAKKQLQETVADFEARIERLESALERNAQGQRATAALSLLDRQLQAMRADRAEVDAPATRQRPLAAAVGDAARGGELGRASASPAGRAQPAGKGKEGGSAAAPAAPAPDPLPRPGAEARPAESRPAAAAQDADAARFAEIEAAHGEMLVMLEGMDSPKPLSEVMAAVRAEAAAEAADAPLLQVAAQCFLTGAR